MEANWDWWWPCCWQWNKIPSCLLLHWLSLTMTFEQNGSKKLVSTENEVIPRLVISMHYWRAWWETIIILTREHLLQKGSITVQLETSLTGLESTKQENTLFVCSKATESQPVKLETIGQSYKASTIVIYDSRVIPDLKIPHITTLDS